MSLLRLLACFGLTGAILLVSGCAHLPHANARCEVVRAAVDIGSGTTKMVVARVDRCRGQVLEVLAPTPGTKLERKVEYARWIDVAADGRRVFTPRVIAEGQAAIIELRTVALSYNATEFSAVATSAFRNVDETHARDVLARIEHATGIPCSVMTQEQEARVGYLATATKLGLSRESSLVVWDMGGGSTQISRWDPQGGSIAGYRGRFASEAMRRFIVEELQRRGYESGLLSDAAGTDRTEVLELAILQAAMAVDGDVSPALMTTLREPDSTIIGIGGVHYYSNCELMRRFDAEGCTFTRGELLSQVRRHAPLTHRELVDRGCASTIEYAGFRVPGALLTLGFMNAFGIESVRAIKVDMADGILTDPNFWSPRRQRRGCEGATD
jgi:exopolyphosphatase/guanosine-5'-triphosphate,3'-diphosphate pyrophosphatase